MKNWLIICVQIRKLLKMPYNQNGKIDRVKLKEMYKEVQNGKSY